MEKTKKKFLLIALLSAILVLCCGMALLLAPTSVANTTNTNMTVEALTDSGNLEAFGNNYGSWSYYGETKTLIIDGGYSGANIIADDTDSVSESYGVDFGESESPWLQYESAIDVVEVKNGCIKNLCVLVKDNFHFTLRIGSNTLINGGEYGIFGEYAENVLDDLLFVDGVQYVAWGLLSYYGSVFVSGSHKIYFPSSVTNVDSDFMYYSDNERIFDLYIENINSLSQEYFYGVEYCYCYSCDIYVSYSDYSTITNYSEESGLLYNLKSYYNEIDEDNKLHPVAFLNGMAFELDTTNNTAVLKSILSTASADDGRLTTPNTIDYNDVNYVVTGIGSYVLQKSIGKNIEFFAINSNVVNIAQCAFGNSGLTTVQVGSGVKNIGDFAFSGCNLLALSILSNHTTFGNMTPSLISYGFSGSIQRVYTSSIANWLTHTFEYPNNNPINFSHNLYLTSFGEPLVADLEIPNGTTAVGANAFYGCTSLTSVTIPSSVTSIGAGAFAYSGIETLTLSEGLQTIGASAFDHCEDLESVTIPSSVTSIGAGAFSNCTQLATATFEGTIPPEMGVVNDKVVFSNNASGFKIIVPPTYENTYKDATSWTGNGNSGQYVDEPGNNDEEDLPETGVVLDIILPSVVILMTLAAAIMVWKKKEQF